MRLVASFDHALSDVARAHIRDAMERLTPDEWRPIVVDHGGIVYDLDQPLTIVIEASGRTVVEQAPREVRISSRKRYDMILASQCVSPGLVAQCGGREAFRAEYEVQMSEALVRTIDVLLSGQRAPVQASG